MEQPAKKNRQTGSKVKKKQARKPLTVSEIIKKKQNRKHPKYGTSKLEDKFAKEFLDKLGVPYERQYEARDIKRFYDFKVYERILIEVDGDYYHGKDLLHEEKNPMQKHNEYVDKIKDEWARTHGFHLYRIWEEDINHNPQKVYKTLVEAFGIEARNNDKKKRH